MRASSHLTPEGHAVSYSIHQGVHTMHAKLFLRPADIARELDISSTTVMRKIHAGEIPAIAVSERIFRIPAESFELYKAGRLRSAEPAPMGGLAPRPAIGEDESLPNPERSALVRPA